MTLQVRETPAIGSAVIKDADQDGFSVNGLRFRMLRGADPNRQTTTEEVVILKPPHFLKKYDDVFRSLPAGNVVEIGIAEGGSLLYFAQAFPHLTFVGIDLRRPNPIVQHHIDRLGLQDRIKLHYGIDQADEIKVTKAIASSLGTEPIGAIIDDASHWYEQSRRTFEITFGMLAPGGVYCFEDWSWAHEPGRSQETLWLDKLSASNLVFEMIMLQPSVSDLVRKITVDRNVVFLERGRNPMTKLDLDKLILNRGKKLGLI